MIDRIKTGFKMIPYGHNFKSMTALGIAFYVLGLAMLFLSEDMFFIASIYMVLGPMYIIQVSALLECSTLIASSPKRNIFYMTLTDCISIISVVVNYVIIYIYMYMNLRNHPEAETLYATRLVLFGIATFILVIYMGVAFKKFILSFLFFFIGFFTVYTFGERFLLPYKISFANATLISMAIGASGIVVGHVLRRILKKAPIQNISVSRSLRKYL